MHTYNIETVYKAITLWNITNVPRDSAVGWCLAVGWCRIWRYTREMLIKQLSLDFTGESPPESPFFFDGGDGWWDKVFSLWFCWSNLRDTYQEPWGLGRCQTIASSSFSFMMTSTKLGSCAIYFYLWCAHFLEKRCIEFSVGLLKTLRKFSQGLVRLLISEKPCWMCKTHRKWWDDDNLSGGPNPVSTGWILKRLCNLVSSTSGSTLCTFLLTSRTSAM